MNKSYFELVTGSIQAKDDVKLAQKMVAIYSNYEVLNATPENQRELENWQLRLDQADAHYAALSTAAQDVYVNGGDDCVSDAIDILEQLLEYTKYTEQLNKDIVTDMLIQLDNQLTKLL